MTEDETCDDQKKESEAILDKAASELFKTFDSVRIITTKMVEGTPLTQFVSRGRGNFYAQRGSVQEWLDYQKGDAFDQARRNNDQSSQ